MRSRPPGEVSANAREKVGEAPTCFAPRVATPDPRATWQRALVAVWSLLLAGLVLGPALGPGYVLSYDMVWVPHLALDRDDLWGLGSALPRAVPSDAVVALLGAAIDPQVVQRLVLLGALVLAGVGGARLVPTLGTTGRLAAAALAVWNPYVLERLAIGQWPMLLGYAGLLWLVGELRRDDPRPGE